MLHLISILLAAAAPQPSAQAVGRVSVRVVAGERIEFASAARQPDRQITEAVRRIGPEGAPVKLRLVEFQ